jgi:hypothetical protein
MPPNDFTGYMNSSLTVSMVRNYTLPFMFGAAPRNEWPAASAEKSRYDKEVPHATL